MDERDKEGGDPRGSNLSDNVVRTIDGSSYVTVDQLDRRFESMQKNISEMMAALAAKIVGS